MKRDVKPAYYDQFHCIADQCSFTCCKEWKIAVDDVTYEKWKNEKLSDSNHYLSQYTRMKDGEHIVRLEQDNHCPFLCDNQLCRLVSEKGEKSLSKTCHTFPRQVHEFSSHTEYSLVSCCPEVVDLLKRGDIPSFQVPKKIAELDPMIRIRNLLFEVMESRECSVETGLKMCFFILLDIRENQNENQINFSVYEKRERVELQKGMEELPPHLTDTLMERNEFFLDLAQNYREQRIYARFLEPLAQIAEKLESGEIENEPAGFLLKIKEYEDLFRKIVLNELYTNSLLPESNLDSLIMMVQWIAMEYVAMIHVMFLQMTSQAYPAISYETVRDSIVLIARMTGYDQEDIHEYMEHCFQNIIWDWGYFELLV